MLRDNLSDHLAMHISETEVPPLEAVGKPLVVDPQQVKDGGLEVMDVKGVPGDVVAELAGFSV